MGAWSTGSFGNDDALDYLEGLSDFDAVIETVTVLSARPDDLDVRNATAALAACDLVAAGLGRPPADLPELRDIRLRTVSETVLGQAKTLVDHVRTTSELAELWDDDLDEWHASLDALLIRVTPEAPYTPPESEPWAELPDNFIGHCYVCRDVVTERDGLKFDYDDGTGGIFGATPHRACIEAKLDGRGPHWTPDGAPLAAARRQMVIDFGHAPEDLTEHGDLLPAARRRLMLAMGYRESHLTEDGFRKSDQR